MQAAHQAKGEWRDSWRIQLNPGHRTEGFCFHLVGCPIAKHAKEHGYGELLPYLCKTDHYGSTEKAVDAGCRILYGGKAYVGTYIFNRGDDHIWTSKRF